MVNNWFSDQIIDWYHKNKRDLPWRRTKDPYIIWLSEIILQQTRVTQGLPYFLKFVERFPSLNSLADAEEQEVLRLWQGLGYYSRARNMLATAKLVKQQKGGKFPGTYSELITLKGIGEYTAAAISSFSTDEKVPVVDGNVYRVLSRMFDIELDIMSPKNKKTFRELACSLLPDKDTSHFNQGIMEFGALHCTPKNPACTECPLQNKCLAFLRKTVLERPVKSKKIKAKERQLNYLVYTWGNKLLMRERTGKDIWKGLFEFYLINNQSPESGESGKIPQLNDPVLKFNVSSNKNIKFYKHILSHQIILSKFFIVNLDNVAELTLKEEEKDYKFYDLEEIKRLPKSILIEKFLIENFF